MSFSWMKDLVGETLPGVAVGLEAPKDVLNRAGDEEVLLLQAQFLSFKHVVIGVEDFGQILRQDFVGHRVHVRTAIEIIQVELFRRLGRPEPEGVHRVPAVAHHRQVVGHARPPFWYPPSAIPNLWGRTGFDAAFKLHLEGKLRMGDFPGIAELQPFIRLST